MAFTPNYAGGAQTITSLSGTERIPVDAGGSVSAFTTASAIASLSGTSPTYNNVTVTGLLYESTTSSVAAAGTTQAAATNLTTELNLVATATAGSATGVRLPASASGLTIIVENASGTAIQVYGASTDTINGVATATGVSQMNGSVVIYTCYAAGAWFANGLGTGYSGSLETVSNTTNITAATGGQGSATALTTMQNNVTTVASGAGVILPASLPGMQITVINNGANALAVFCPSGATMNGTLNASSSLATASVGLYFCVAANTWVSK